MRNSPNNIRKEIYKQEEIRTAHISWLRMSNDYLLYKMRLLTSFYFLLYSTPTLNFCGSYCFCFVMVIVFTALGKCISCSCSVSLSVFKWVQCWPPVLLSYHRSWFFFNTFIHILVGGISLLSSLFKNG